MASGAKLADADLAARLAHVTESIRVATAQAGAAIDSVTLVAVAKRQPIAALIALYDLGVRDFGENFYQEMQAHAEALAATGRRPRWHFIGALQGNKVARVTQVSHVIHSVDSAACAQAIVAAAARQGLSPAQVPELLLQVRLADDPSRMGVPICDAVACAQAISDTGAPLVGLMGVPPQGQDPRPHFAHLRRLRDALKGAGAAARVEQLSMGMSEDFAAAIAEGATMVRVGSALFGPRPPATRTKKSP